MWFLTSHISNFWDLNLSTEKKAQPKSWEVYLFGGLTDLCMGYCFSDSPEGLLQRSKGWA